MNSLLRWVLPATLLAFAGCAGGGSDQTANADQPATTARAWRDHAVCDARVGSTLASQHTPKQRPGAVTIRTE
jgi:hypothetical protein